MKKGFTLAELLTVVIIIGVLASLALPVFTRTVEQTRADQAAAYLRRIRAGEKMYYASNGNYATAANAGAIRTALGVELTTESFSYGVVGGATFTATATRNAGPCGGQTITINDTGNWTGTYETGGIAQCLDYFNSITK